MNLALIGQNISYSLSPLIHKTSAKILGLEISYELIDLNNSEIEDLPEIVAEKNITAFNVTKPYKLKVPGLFGDTDAKAINTAFLKEGKWEFSSTDYLGFKFSLNKIGLDVDNIRQVIFLGNGGSALSIFEGIKNENSLCEFHVLRRSDERDGLFTGANISFGQFSTEEFTKLTSEHRGALIIQATPLPQMGNDLSEFASGLSLNFTGSYVDLTYGFKNKLLEKISHLGLRGCDGIPMLLGQALSSQKIWWGQSASYDQLISEIGSKL